MLAGDQSCAVLVKSAPGGCEHAAVFQEEPVASQGFPHASSTSRGCQVSHAAQPGSSPPGRRQAGQGLQQGSVPLLAPFPCSLHSPGSLEEQMSEEEGRDPSMGGMGSCYLRLSMVQLGW